MMGLSNLKAPFALLTESASYFRRSDSHFLWALFLRIVIKLSRFVAFLLPFKALMFAVTGRDLHIGGYLLPGAAVVALILVLAIVTFAVFLSSSRAYASLTRSVFHTDDAPESINEEVAEKTRPDSDAHSMYTTVSGFFASLILIAVLLTAITVVIPQTFLLVIVPVLYTLYVAYQIGAARNGQVFDIQKAATVFTFGSMVTTLVFIGWLVSMNVPIGPISALFVFIASRQMTGSVSEAVSALHRNRHAIAPRFLRARLDNIDHSDFQVSVRAAPFLTTAQQQVWIGKTVGEISGGKGSVKEVKWRKFGIRDANLFELVLDHDGGTVDGLLVIFERRSLAAYKQYVAFLRSFSLSPLVLPQIGYGVVDGYGTILFSREDWSFPDANRLRSKIADLIVELWSIPIPPKTGLITHTSDHLNWINAETLDILSAVSWDAAQAAALDWFKEEYQALKARNLALPVTFAVPSLTPYTVLGRDDGTFKILHWSMVDVQPAGAHLARLLPGWRQFDHEEMLARIRARRPDFEDVTITDINYSLDLFRLGKALQRYDYADALSIISALHTGQRTVEDNGAEEAE